MGGSGNSRVRTWPPYSAVVLPPTSVAAFNSNLIPMSILGWKELAPMFTLKYVNFISYPTEFDTEFSESVAPLRPSSSNGRSKVTRLLHGAADNNFFMEANRGQERAMAFDPQFFPLISRVTLSKSRSLFKP